MRGELRFITRQEHGRTNGWYVKITRGKFRVFRFFGDRKYGGKDKALVQAKRFRDLKEKGSEQFKLIQTGNGGMREGWFGLRRVVSANISIKGKRYSTCFGIQKHGLEGARKLANQWLDKKRRLRK